MRQKKQLDSLCNRILHAFICEVGFLGVRLGHEKNRDDKNLVFLNN